MEKLQLRHSNKNIPIPSQQSYKLQLMGKINLAIKQMGLESLLLRTKKMINFENDLTNLLKTIKFRITKSSLQQQLTEDIKIIQKTKITLTFADKTSNVYNSTKRL